MKFKKTAAGIIAAAVTASCLTFTASAAENKLVTTSYSDVFGDNSYYRLGDGYFALYKSYDPSAFKIIHIGNDEVAQWISTGNLEYKTIEAGADIGELYFSSGILNDSFYLTFIGDNTHLFNVNKDSGEWSEVYEYPGRGEVTRSDGYSLGSDFDYDSGVLTYSVAAPDGAVTKYSLTYTQAFEDEQYYYRVCPAHGDGEYVGYIEWKVSGSVNVVNPDEYWSEDNTADYDLYGIKKDGSLDRIYTAKETFYDGTFDNLIVGYADNYVAWWAEDCLHIRTTDGNVHNLTGLNYTSDYIYSVTGVYGNQAIVAERVPARSGGNYMVVDITGEGKEVSKKYDSASISTGDDGKIYLVNASEDDNWFWGFIDSAGNELAKFDDASNFIGDGAYAPVVQDGKGWLVDRNMNQVSEKIDADGCITVAENLFRFSTPDGYILAALSAEAAPASSESTASQTNDQASASSDTNNTDAASSNTGNTGTANSDKGNADTGAEGVAVFAAVAVIAAGAVVIGRKRK